MAKKSYSPVASYNELKQVEVEINKAETIKRIRDLVHKDGPKIGYKAFCYMLGGRMTPEAMKPDEACVAAGALEQQGKTEEALEIYQKVIAEHPDHPLAKGKVSA